MCYATQCTACRSFILFLSYNRKTRMLSSMVKMGYSYSFWLYHETAKEKNKRTPASSYHKRKLVWPWKLKQQQIASERTIDSFQCHVLVLFPKLQLITYPLLSMSFKSIFWSTTLISISISMRCFCYFFFFFHFGATRIACSMSLPSHTQIWTFKWTQKERERRSRRQRHASAYNWSCRKHAVHCD